MVKREGTRSTILHTMEGGGGNIYFVNPSFQGQIHGNCPLKKNIYIFIFHYFVRHQYVATTVQNFSMIPRTDKIVFEYIACDFGWTDRRTRPLKM